MDVQTSPSFFLPWMILTSGLLPFYPLRIKDNLISIWKSVDVQPALSSVTMLCNAPASVSLYIEGIQLPTQDWLDLIYLHSENPWKITFGKA